MYLSKKVDFLVVAFIKLGCDYKNENIVLAIGEEYWCCLCHVQFINISNLHANRPICQISKFCQKNHHKLCHDYFSCMQFKTKHHEQHIMNPKAMNYKWNSEKKKPLKVTIMVIPRSWKLTHNESNTKHQYISTYDDNVAFLLHVINICLLNRLAKSV